MALQSITHRSSADPVGRAAAALAAGRPVVLTDDGRDHEAALVFAASLATPALLDFTVRHTSGFVQVALIGDDCRRLALPPMPGDEGNHASAAYRVTVDLLGTGTGISGTARAHTIAALASAESTAADFTRPGHVVPMLAHERGVLARPRRAEAAVELARLAGLRPAAAFSELVSLDHPLDLTRGEEAVRFAEEYELALVSIGELVSHCRRTQPAVRRAEGEPMPGPRQGFCAIAYEDIQDGTTHVAVVAGKIVETCDVPVYIHAECLTRDVLGDAHCACGRDLEIAMETIAHEGYGVVIYVRQSGAIETCATAGIRVGSSVVPTAVDILTDLGVGSVRLILGHRGLRVALQSCDLPVSSPRAAARRPA